MGQKKPCTDHAGRKYPSVPEMCAAYGIPFSTYSGRLERGWTQEQALTTPTRGNGPKVNPRSNMAKDHTGQEFVSISAMCRHWGIDEKVYWSRKRLLQWPLEKILTTPVRDRYDAANAKSVTDHEGREFPSISDMCRHWRIGLSTYRERRKRGWDVGRALTGKQIKIKTDPVTCTDHEGNGYPSKNAMCAAWGVTRYCYDSRIQRGWTQEQALSGRHVINARPCEDHTGKKFPSAVHMALYLGFPEYAFQGSRSGMAGKIPELAAKYWQGRKCGATHVRRCVDFPWFLASQDGFDVLLHFGQMLDMYHRSDDFRPLPETNLKNPTVRAVKPVEWPWYLCRIGQERYVLSYDALVRTHMESNFGISMPET